MEVTRILIDTSAYSAFMRGHVEILGVLQRADEISFCPIVLGELLAGFLSGSHRAKNEAELEQFLSSPRVLLLQIDQGTAERYAVIFNSLRKAGTPISANDLWIAACAMQHGLRLLTTDTDFQSVNQVIVDYFPIA